jgi:TolA-binding protein
MKRKALFVTIATLLSVFTAAPALAIAHEGEDHSEATTTSASDGTVKATATATVPTKTREERIADLKAAFKTKLTTVQQTRIKNRCIAAQAIVTKLISRVETVETNRGKLHTNLLERLNTLKSKVEAAGVDTHDIATEITALEALIDTMNNDLASYKQAVIDLSELDCEMDPTAFQAALEATRTLRQTVATDAAAIRSYVKDTIKPTLEAIRTALAEKKAASEDE